jgi:hypothetical protein
MKRYHQNLTNETMVFRTWRLLVDEIDESDFKWLKAFDMYVTIDRPTQTFSTSSGGSYTISATPIYTVDTTTNKQRDMLILKYGSSAILMQEDIVIPGTISTCTLDRISW